MWYWLSVSEIAQKNRLVMPEKHTCIHGNFVVTEKPLHVIGKKMQCIINCMKENISKYEK